MRLKAHWKLNLPPSWTSSVLTSFCHSLHYCVILLKVVPCPLPSCFTTSYKLGSLPTDNFLLLTELRGTLYLLLQIYFKGYYKGYKNSHWASLVAHMVRKLPAVQETWVWSLGREDLLEKGMVTHSSILAWRGFHRQRSLAVSIPRGCRVRHDWVTNTHTNEQPDKGVCMARYKRVLSTGASVSREFGVHTPKLDMFTKLEALQGFYGSSIIYA